MRVRFALGVLVCCLSLLALCATASACLPSTPPPPSPNSAGPGDRIDFNIGGVEPGAHWTITAPGKGVIKEGTKQNDGVHGLADYFVMPDYEETPPDEVDFWLEVTHEDPYPAVLLTVGYLTPAAAAPSPSGSGASASDSTAQPGAAAHVAAPKQVSPTPRHDNDNRGTADVPTVAPAEAVSGDAGLGHASSSPTETQAMENSSSVPHRILDAVGSTTSVGPAKVPTAGLLALALIFVVGTAVAAFVIYLFQRGPDPKAAIRAPAPLGHDPVEVELQEMIAEEMARKLLSDLELAEPPVSSR